MPKTIFDHLRGITVDKVPWESLTDEDRKSWNTYLVNRWLSMEPDFITFVNTFQNFTYFSTLTDEQYYKILFDALPKQQIYFKYIKKKSVVMIEDEIFKIFVNHFNDRKEIVYENIIVLSKIADEELVEILKMYGVQPDVMDKFKKTIEELKKI